MGSLLPARSKPGFLLRFLNKRFRIRQQRLTSKQSPLGGLIFQVSADRRTILWRWCPSTGQGVLANLSSPQKWLPHLVQSVSLNFSYPAYSPLSVSIPGIRWVQTWWLRWIYERDNVGRRKRNSETRIRGEWDGTRCVSCPLHSAPLTTGMYPPQHLYLLLLVLSRILAYVFVVMILGHPELKIYMPVVWVGTTNRART